MEINNFLNNSKKNLSRYFSKKSGLFLLIFIVSAILFSRIFVSAQQDSTLEEKILQKLETVIKAQSDNQGALNTILSRLDEVKKELEVIKIRATVH